MSYTVKEIAKILDTDYVGDGDVIIRSVMPPAEAKEGDLVFVISKKFIPLAQKSKASAFLCDKNLNFVDSLNRPLILSERPKEDMIKVLALFEKSLFKGGIDKRAVIDETVKLGKGVYIGPNVVLERGVCIGDGCYIMANSFIGEDSILGNNVFIYPNVVILHDVKIGNNVIIHSGSVIGSDGYGFLQDFEGGHKKIPQIGGVIIEDDVEIGANVTVDRATMGYTVIGKGTKIDNLVHIAHNVKIGKNCLIVAMSGISGSAVLEDNVIMAGQTGVKDHVKVGRGSVIAAKSGVTKDLPPNSFVSGFPAWDHRQEMRVQALVRRLPELFQKINTLEERMKEIVNFSKKRK